MVRRLSPAGALRAASLALLLAASPALAATPLRSAPAPDALPSWKEGPTKRAILGFVERVSRPGSADYVPPAERIATFDTDGTLWPENPLPFQLADMIDESDGARRPGAPEHSSKLSSKPPQRGWTVVSMKDDWKRVF